MTVAAFDGDSSAGGGGGTLHPESTVSPSFGKRCGGFDGGGGGTTALTLVGESDRIGAPNAVFGLGMLGFVGRVTRAGRGDVPGGVIGGFGTTGARTGGSGTGLIAGELVKARPAGGVTAGGSSGLSDEGGGGGTGGRPNVGPGIGEGEGCSVIGEMLTGTTLTGTSLSGVSLTGTTLIGASLTGTSLIGPL